MTTLDTRFASPTRLVGVALLLAGGVLAAAGLAAVHPGRSGWALAAALLLTATTLAAGALLHCNRGPQPLAQALLASAVVLATALILLPEHPTLLAQLLPVVGGGGAGALLVSTGRERGTAA